MANSGVVFPGSMEEIVEPAAGTSLLGSFFSSSSYAQRKYFTMTIIHRSTVSKETRMNIR